MNSRRAVPVAIAGVFLWIIGAYFTTAADIAGVWWRSESYAHGLMVIPIFAWLVWRKREVLATRPLRAWPIWLLPVAVAGFGWLLGQLGSVASVSHFCLVTMLVLTLFGVLGREAAGALKFPLLFLLFGIPAGEFLLPVMMKYTALFTVSAVRLMGVPVYQEGLHFVLPNGRWSVIEACSGFRYLIASVMVGTLYAYLSFRSLRRRLIFTAVAIVMPVVANWLRAFMIVMLGYFSNNQLATGVDHLIYGWVFFGLVILLMFWVGSFWREDLDELPAAAAVPAPAASIDTAALVRGVLPFALLTAVWPVVAVLLAAPTDRDVTIPIALPAAGGAWRAGGVETGYAFQPRFSGHRGLMEEGYSDGRRTVNAYVAVYANQSQGRELVRAGNVLLSVEDHHWAMLDEGAGPETPFGAWKRSVLSGEGTRIVVWSAYWIDGRLVTSDYVAKGLLTLARLTGKADTSAYVAMWSRAPDERSAEQALEDAAASLQGPLFQQLQSLDRVK
ncbi:MAG TPA: exosortase A [Rhodocyclaceae bacterium]|nr:exosortase A [Rhodocyclaceae bacterium]